MAAPGRRPAAEVAHEGAGVTQWNHEAFLAPPGGRGARAVSGSAAGTPSSPCQLSTVGTGSSFCSVISSSSPRLKRRSIGAWASSDHIGVFGAPGRRRGAGFGLQQQRGAALRGSDPRQGGSEDRQRPIRPEARVGPAGNLAICHDRCGPFSAGYVQLRAGTSGVPQKRPFFCCGLVRPML
jgi:hypothetical protein